MKRKYDCDEEGHANDGSCLCFKQQSKYLTAEVVRRWLRDECADPIRDDVLNYTTKKINEHLFEVEKSIFERTRDKAEVLTEHCPHGCAERIRALRLEDL